jgi:hypothetical protein
VRIVRGCGRRSAAARNASTACHRPSCGGVSSSRKPRERRVNVTSAACTAGNSGESCSSRSIYRSVIDYFCVVAKCFPTSECRRFLRRGGGRTWWAHHRFTRINIELTISKNQIEELMNVRGIGEVSFLKLKPLITVIPPRTDRAATQ